MKTVFRIVVASHNGYPARLLPRTFRKYNTLWTYIGRLWKEERINCTVTMHVNGEWARTEEYEEGKLKRAIV